jgi:DNA-binding IscR family transcriptional regulator
MIPLRRAKLVVAERGVQGGYRIARSGITCHDVLSASEGDFHPAPCQDCGRSEACKTHQIWSLLQNAVVDYSKQVYIEDLASHLVEQEVGGGI